MNYIVQTLINRIRLAEEKLTFLTGKLNQAHQIIQQQEYNIKQLAIKKSILVPSTKESRTLSSHSQEQSWMLKKLPGLQKIAKQSLTKKLQQ